MHPVSKRMGDSTRNRMEQPCSARLVTEDGF